MASFVRQNHYSRTFPGGIDYCFAAVWEKRIVGAAMFGYIAGNPKAMVVYSDNDDVHRYRELMRFCLIDKAGKNSESRFIGYCLRWLKRNTDLLAIISFADPKQGHKGTIYQATNWIYTGVQKQDRDRIILQKSDLFGDYEEEVHPKQAYNEFGSSGKDSVGQCRFEAREPKHRYVYPLRPNLKLKYKEVPYA